MSDITITNHAFLPHRKTLSNPAGYLLGGYTHRMPIAIDYTNFVQARRGYPILIDITDSGLRTIANGGYVVNDDGSDIAFTGDDKINHIPVQIAVYNPTTGHLMAWIRVPLISNSADTIVYLYLGATTADPNKPNESQTWAIEEDLIISGEVDTYVKDLTPAARNGIIVDGTVEEETGLNGMPAGKITAEAKVVFPAVGTANAFSLTGWIKHAANPGSGWATILSSVDLSSSEKFELQISQDSNGPLTMRINNSDIITDVAVAAIGDLGWHHYGIVLDSTGLRFYLDASLLDTDLANPASVANTDSPLTFANLAEGGSGWLGRFSLTRFANFAKNLDDITLERLIFLNPSSMITPGAFVAIPEVTANTVDEFEIPITLVGEIDLNHVHSDYNVFYQDPTLPIVQWINPPIGLPASMTLSEWQKLGQDLHSRFADPSDPVVAENINRYTDIDTYAINNVIGGPCCARFLFCTEQIGMETCDPTLPIFIQNVQSKAGDLGWSNLMIYDESGAKFELRTYCGACDKNGLLKDYPTSYP